MATISLQRRFRALFLALAALAAGVFLFTEAWQSLTAGVFILKSKYGLVSFMATQVERPFAFGGGVAALLLFGLLLCAFGTWQVLALLRPAITAHQPANTDVISGLEQLAPSGLKPLWVGLLVVAVCFALYAAA
jgi:hypothetical protein